MTSETIRESGWRQDSWTKDEPTGFFVTEQEREITIPKQAFERFTEKVETQELLSKISALEREVEELKNGGQQINVPESVAEKILRDAIKQLKDKGISGVDIIDLHIKTRLPIAQIGKIMEKLEGEGVVSEDEETQNC